MFYILFGLFLCTLWLWFKRNKHLDPPVLSGRLPIFGHALLGLGDGVRMFKIIENITTEAEQKGGVFKAYMGPATLYGITSAEDALTVSNVCLEKHFVYNVSKPLFRNGLLTADVNTWRKNRKLLNPAFTPQVLSSLIDSFNSQARKMVEQLGREEGKVFDHEKIIRQKFLETICMTTLGADAEEFGELQKKYLNNVETVVKIVDRRFRQIWLASDVIFSLTPLKKKFDNAIEILRNLARTIIIKKLAQIKSAEMGGNEADEMSKFTRTILNVASEGSMTSEQVQSEIDTLIAAGHDTGAGTITFAISLLGSHPDVQEKAYQEILQVVGDSDRNLEKDDLAKLTFIDAVLKETLRLFPIIPVIGREMSQDIKLRNCTLKPNIGGCYISIHGVLRDKMWGEDRHEFRPERWLEKDTLPDPKYFAAFGMGRRTCIGKQYAMISMKIMLSHVLRQYKISSDVSKMVVRSTFVLRPDMGHHISIEKRCK